MVLQVGSGRNVNGVRFVAPMKRGLDGGLGRVAFVDLGELEGRCWDGLSESE